MLCVTVVLCCGGYEFCQEDWCVFLGLYVWQVLSRGLMCVFRIVRVTSFVKRIDVCFRSVRATSFVKRIDVCFRIVRVTSFVKSARWSSRWTWSVRKTRRATSPALTSPPATPKSSLSVISPVTWNSLPFAVRHAQTIPSFKSQLKTDLFCQSKWYSLSVTFSFVALMWPSWLTGHKEPMIYLPFIYVCVCVSCVVYLYCKHPGLSWEGAH